jgi:hypothetical protein
MSAEETKEEVAKALLREVIESLIERSDEHRRMVQAGALQIVQDAEGWAVLIFCGVDTEGRGGLSFIYRPRAFVKKLLEDAEKRFDEMTAKCHFRDEGSTRSVFIRDNVTAEFRENTIREAAWNGVFTAIAMLLITMGRTLDGQYQDSLTVVEGELKRKTVESFEGQTYEEDGDKVTVLSIDRNMREPIEERVQAVANEKREYLQAVFANISALRVPSGHSGRPVGSGKPAEIKHGEKLKFEQEIESAIKNLIDRLSRMPTKTEVAQELNIGGRSFRTGNDTSLNAFNNKLGRLDVDYTEIIQRIKYTNN